MLNILSNAISPMNRNRITIIDSRVNIKTDILWYRSSLNIIRRIDEKNNINNTYPSISIPTRRGKENRKRKKERKNRNRHTRKRNGKRNNNT